MEENNFPNRLTLYRKRMKFSQKDVAQILKTAPSAISHYERGVMRPSLERALALEIVYRVPVAFFYPELYDKLREQLHDRESRLQNKEKE